MGMLEFSQMLITKAFWSDCIDLFVKWVGNYGWAIILLTIAIKLVLTPIEIMQKRVNAKNAKMQAIMQPELQKVQQQFPGDRNKLNQKQMELAKKYNFNMTGTCFILLISMIITLVVFTSLFTGINSLSKKQEKVAFNEIYQTYTQAVDYTVDNEEDFLVDGSSVEIDQAKVDAYINKQVKDKFKQQSKKYSFMWVKNVWKGDKPVSPVVGYSSFEKYAIKQGIIANTDEAKAEFKEEYNTIKGIIEEDNKNNGCYLLIILAGVITFLVQFMQVKLQEKKTGMKNPSAKTMLIIMPVFMIIFASTSSALFTLYIIANSIMSALISTTIDLCTPTHKDKPGEVVYKKGNTEVVEYSRNYNKG